MLFRVTFLSLGQFVRSEISPIRSLVSFVSIIVSGNLLMVTEISAESDEKIQYVLMRKNIPTQLNCSGPKLMAENAQKILWSHNNQSLPAHDESIRMNRNLTELILQSPNETNIGDYECRRIRNAKIYRSKRFRLLMKPTIKIEALKTDLNNPIRLNDEWSIDCRFLNPAYRFDANLSVVRCTFDSNRNLKLDDKERQYCSAENLDRLKHRTERWNQENLGRIIQSDLTDSETNEYYRRFRIKNVFYKDKGFYACISVNPVANETILIPLRIEDSIDSVWPLIILVTLAFYLFAFIAIYEIRRIRPTSLLKLEWDK